MNFSKINVNFQILKKFSLNTCQPLLQRFVNFIWIHCVTFMENQRRRNSRLVPAIHFVESISMKRHQIAQRMRSPRASNSGRRFCPAHQSLWNDTEIIFGRHFHVFHNSLSNHRQESSCKIKSIKTETRE